MLTSQIFRDLVLRVSKIRPKSCCKSVLLDCFKSCGCFWNVVCVYVHWINGTLFILQLQTSSSLTYCQTPLLHFTKCHFKFPFKGRIGFAGCEGVLMAGKAGPALWDRLSTTWDCSQRALPDTCRAGTRGMCWEGCSHNNWYRCKKRKRQQKGKSVMNLPHKP